MMEKDKKVTKSNNTTKKNTGSKTSKNTKSTTKKVENKGNKKVEVKETKKVEIKDNNIKTEIVNKKEENIKKKVKVSKNNNEPSTDFGGEEIRKLLIIIGAVCAVMLAFYFITEVVLKNKKENTETTKEPEITIEPEIQYEQILMGSLLNQDESTYYVFAYTEDDPMLDIYNQYLESYKNSDNEPLNVYRVNLTEDFNKSYVADESYLEGDDVTKVKVTGTTLIRIKNDEIYKYYEGYEEISEKLKSMID